MDLNELCSTPDARRDYMWEKKFLDAFVQGEVTLVKEESILGPDGWPYFFVKTQITTNTTGEPVVRLLSWLKDKGIGLVINGDKELPDYIFNYGMIWNFAERKLLIQEDPNYVDSDQVEFKEGEKVFFGCPSKEYLPPYVAQVLLDFFDQQKVEDPRVAIIGKDKEHYDLCFSLESLGNPEEEEHQGILTAISWFLPTHYSLMLLSEDAVSDFFPLRDLCDSDRV